MVQNYYFDVNYILIFVRYLGLTKIFEFFTNIQSCNVGIVVKFVLSLFVVSFFLHKLKLEISAHMVITHFTLPTEF